MDPSGRINALWKTPSGRISALWKTIRMKCLLFKQWYSGIVSQTKIPSHGNVGNQVTEERRGNCLLWVSDIIVYCLKRDPCPPAPYAPSLSLRIYALPALPSYRGTRPYSWTQ